jgi:hypothetical protein
MKRESTLAVQSEEAPAYAGRRQRQTPAPRLRPPEAPYSHVVRSPRGTGAGRVEADEPTITKTRQSTRKIFDKKRGWRMACNFTEADVQAECVKREQELEDAGLLLLDGGKFISGREAAYESLVDDELCRDLVSEYARESAKRTEAKDIGTIRDNYEAIVLGFIRARSVSVVLRNETDQAPGDFLRKLGNWIRDYVSCCIQGKKDRCNWTLSGHTVSKELLTALAQEYFRDPQGLMRFLEAVFKRWRELISLTACGGCD